MKAAATAAMKAPTMGIAVEAGSPAGRIGICDAAMIEAAEGAGMIAGECTAGADRCVARKSAARVAEP
jgi:hypothetical protein